MAACCIRRHDILVESVCARVVRYSSKLRCMHARKVGWGRHAVCNVIRRSLSITSVTYSTSDVPVLSSYHPFLLPNRNTCIIQKTAAQRQAKLVAEALVDLNWESRNQNATCTIANHLQYYAEPHVAFCSVDLNYVTLALLLLPGCCLRRLSLSQLLHVLYLLGRRPLPILLRSAIR